MGNGLLAFFGVFSGVTTVLFGFGGGFLIVPVLYQILLITHPPGDPIAQSAMHIAVATSTCVMIVNSSMSTHRSAKTGKLLANFIWPISGFIGLGAVIGATFADFISGEILRYAFVLYLGITIADCLLRRGFMDAANSSISVKPSKVSTGSLGVGIGAIATSLGVGGSVMTVPLLRRWGLSMAQATSLANPLSIPVAVVGTGSYIVLAKVRQIDFGTWFLGYVDLAAFGLLTMGAVVGIRLAASWKEKISDQVHARIYIALLAIVMVSMAVS